MDTKELSNENTESVEEIVLPKIKDLSNENVVSNISDSSYENKSTNMENNTKVEAGKKINSEGKVEDSSTKKVITAAGRGAAAYFTGGSSIGKDKHVKNFKPIDKTIGVVSDKLDKVPGVEAVSKELDEAGVADGVNDTLDVVGNIKEGNIQGTIESTKKATKDVKKVKKYVTKKILIAVLPVLAFIFIPIFLIIMVCGPVLGGFMDVVENIEEFFVETADTVHDFIFGNEEEAIVIDMASEIEGFDDLSETRQKITTYALIGLSLEIPYKYGNGPTGSGLDGIPSDGLDCSGFVEWVYWSALGTKPNFRTTADITKLIGTDFIEITEDELQPGDIGLKKKGASTEEDYNHTGIYVGNGQWVHAYSGKNVKQVVRNNYSGFTIFLRYKGV